MLGEHNPVAASGTTNGGGDAGRSAAADDDIKYGRIGCVTGWLLAFGFHGGVPKFDFLTPG